MSAGAERVALVTGANKGIGKEIARGLASQGFQILLGARDEKLGEAAANELQTAGCVSFLRLDVGDPATIEAATQHVRDHFGRLDVLVNNAGIASCNDRKFGAFPKPSQLTPADLRGVFETNVFAVVAVTNAFLPLLQQSPAGRIVNVSSARGSFTAPGSMAGTPYLPYSTSKSALNAITVHYAKEFTDSSSHVKINAVCPGYCGTDFNNHTGTKTAAQGAQAAIQMAMIGVDGPNGGFFNDSGVVAW